MSGTTTSLSVLLLLATTGPCTQDDIADTNSKPNVPLDGEVMSASIPSLASDLSPMDNQSCPTWMTKTNTSDEACQCGEIVHAAVKCDSTQQQAYILDCYCMTYDETDGAVVGKCFYRCAASHSKVDTIYHLLPKDPSHLNEEQCGYLNRDGRLCGSCKKGYSPLVYSYDLHCKNCTGGNYNWVKFVAAAFGPLTLFYLFVVVFQCNANSPVLYGFFNVVQAITAPAHLKVMLTYTESRVHPGTGMALKLLMMLYGITNLDFFRTLYTDICLDITPLQRLALGYAVAFYPLVLIFISCVLITIHSRGIRLVVWLWKPFDYCLNCIRKQWQQQTSMIEVIATFLLLSYIKILNVTADLLLFTRVYNVNGTQIGIFLYYDASVEYFGKEHLPYAITAIFVLFTFVSLPVVLLFLYPFKCFQQFLSCTKLRSRVLYTFIDSFQGCYKDGTEPGTRDCRYFSALVFLMRFIYWFIYGVTLNATFYALGLLAILGFSMLYTIFRPYKAKFGVYNTVETCMLLLLAMLHAAVLCINMSFTKSPQFVTLALWFSFTLTCVPLFYIITVTFIWIFKQTKCRQRCVSCLESSKLQNDNDIESNVYSEELPANPEEYEVSTPLLHTCNTAEDYKSCNETVLRETY